MSKFYCDEETKRADISLPKLVYFVLLARASSLLDDNIRAVNLQTGDGEVITFAEYLRGRKL